jgi:hypothetical protein
MNNLEFARCYRLILVRDQTHQPHSASQKQLEWFAFDHASVSCRNSMPRIDFARWFEPMR